MASLLTKPRISQTKLKNFLNTKFSFRKNSSRNTKIIFKFNSLKTKNSWWMMKKKGNFNGSKKYSTEWESTMKMLRITRRPKIAKSSNALETTMTIWSKNKLRLWKMRLTMRNTYRKTIPKNFNRFKSYSLHKKSELGMKSRETPKTRFSILKMTLPGDKRSKNSLSNKHTKTA